MCLVQCTHVLDMPQMYTFRSSCTTVYTMYVCIYTYLYTVLLTCMFITIQATASDLRSQITTLQVALEGEIAARKEYEAKLTSQFQVCLYCKQGVSHLNV